MLPPPPSLAGPLPGQIPAIAGPARVAHPDQSASATTEFEMHASVSAVPREVWDAMLPGAAEDWAYFRAAESCPPKGFDLGVIVGRRGQTVVAVAPVFSTRYELHTSLQGWMRRAADMAARVAPGLLRPRMLSLGSPLLDRCPIGFAPGLDAGERRIVMGELLAGLNAIAARERIALLAFKDVSDADASAFDPLLAQAGFARATHLPMAYVDLPFSCEDEYLASFPRKHGNYLKRKLKALPQLRIEYRSSVADLGNELHELYQSTRANSKAQYGDFDELHPAYFQAVLDNCGERARLMLCWHDDRLVSFQLFIVGGNEIVAKYIGMRYPEARELNLYFVNWMMIFRCAYEQRIGRVRMGNTSYSVKSLLGARLERSWLYFRHRNSAMNHLLHRYASLADVESNDAELQQLAAKSPVGAGSADREETRP